MTEKFHLLEKSPAVAVKEDQDNFSRTQFADQIGNLISNSIDPLVLVLDEPWGSGKTYFSYQLERRLNDDGVISPLYFDAFKNDYEDNPFIALAASILELLGNKSEKGSGLKERAKDVAKVIGRVGLKASVKAISFGAINAGDFSDDEEKLAEDFVNIAEAEFDKLIDNRLNSFKKDEQIFVKFRQELETLAKDKPLLIIVDELDRCKPTYALSLLETIKHFFEVPNVHFLIITNLDALAATVEHQYGAIDGRKYLQKFYSIVLNFPNLSGHEKENTARSFISKCLEGLVPPNNHYGTINDLSDFLLSRMMERSYSLRDIEKLSIYIKMLINFGNPRFIQLVPILAILIDIRTHAPQLYRKAKNDTLTFDDICLRYGYRAEVNPSDGSEEHQWYAVWWRYVLENPKGQEWKDFATDLRMNNMRSSRDLIQNTIRNLIEALPSGT